MSLLSPSYGGPMEIEGRAILLYHVPMEVKAILFFRNRSALKLFSNQMIHEQFNHNLGKTSKRWVVHHYCICGIHPTIDATVIIFLH